jgi:lipoprotein-anchoring transpeptidase ErfK/SrfK
MACNTRVRRALAASLGLAFLAAVVAGCGGGGDGATLGKKITPTTPPSTAAPAVVPEWQSYAARAKGPTLAVFSAPNDATPVQELPNPWVYDPDSPDQTIPQVFLVKERANGWTKVLLPQRPNGSTGWLRNSDITLSPNPYRVVVHLGEHSIKVTKATDTIYEGTIAIGKPSTPTPLGEFYLRILVQSPDPGSVYGPYAYGLSSYSETLDTFAGSDAQVGIHGNNDASVLGSDVTSGCVRIDNDAITMLAKQLPLGTPVEVMA